MSVEEQDEIEQRKDNKIGFPIESPGFYSLATSPSGKAPASGSASIKTLPSYFRNSLQNLLYVHRTRISFDYIFAQEWLDK